MSSLSELQSYLPALRARLDAAQRLLAPPRSERATPVVDMVFAQAAGLVSDAFLGDASLGHQVAAAHLASNHRTDAERAREQATNVVAELHSRLERDISDAAPRALAKWRAEARRLQEAPPARTSTIVGRTTRLLAELLAAEQRAPQRTVKTRDDFAPQTVRALERRAGHHCSNPDCRHPTAGPSDESPTATMIVGEAAHITAAAPGRGARRYDATLTPERRRSIDNGIWLCATCARMIDRDAVLFTVKLLREWKRSAEEWARSRVRRQPTSARPAPRMIVPQDPALQGRLSADEIAELEQLATDLLRAKDEVLLETTRQQSARASLQVLAAYLTRHGLVAHLEQLPEGSVNCPRALCGLALPLLILHVAHQVVVLDDAVSGLFCYFLSANELDRDPLPEQTGWIKIDDAARAHLTILPRLNERLRAGNMVAR